MEGDVAGRKDSRLTSSGSRVVDVSLVCMCARVCGVQSAFAPIVFIADPSFGKYAGRWETDGSGMISFYVTELAKLTVPNRLPWTEKTEWGDEDWALVWVRDRAGSVGSTAESLQPR